MNFINNPDLFHNCERYMWLKISVSSSSTFPDNDLIELYKAAASVHNANMLSNSNPDAGFDLFSPGIVTCLNGQVNKVNFCVKCAATMVCESGKSFNTGFYLYPRSSTGSKTSLRLANSVGIIDSGYRGDLMAVFDSVYGDHVISRHDKVVQICAPGLVPIYVEVVSSLNLETVRGAGGFGSSGN